MGQVSGLFWADRGLKERIGSQPRRHLLGVNRTVEGWKGSYGTGYIGSADGILPPRDLGVFHPKVMGLGRLLCWGCRAVRRKGRREGGEGSGA